jgi:competence protein ComEA
MVTSALAAPEPPAKPQAPQSPLPPSHDTAPAKNPAPAKPEKKIDLNNASKKELMTLPTVGEEEAKKIIAKRPYISKTDLVTKAGLPEGVYLAVRDKVVVNDMRKPAPKK